MPIRDADPVESQEIKLLGISLDNWEIWITIAGAVVASIWGVYQINKNESTDEQEKASEITSTFINGLSNKCKIVCTVFELSRLNILLDFKNKDCYCFSKFTPEEIQQVYQNVDFLAFYKQAKLNADLDTVYYNYLENLVSIETIDEIQKKHKKYSTEEVRSLFILENSNLPFYFDTLIHDVLNELEYLCMYLAGQKVASRYVYTSLHQTVLKTVRVLSVEIAVAKNNLAHEKYFINLIKIYNEWLKIYAKNLKRETKKREDLD